MADKEIITDGCEFQSDCIEYKDISYLKIMPICAIHELSIACHDKVNKCKYYTLYKQLKQKEQENNQLKEDEKSLLNVIDDLQKEKNKWVEKYNDLGQDFDQLKHKKQESKKYKQALDEIEKYLDIQQKYFDGEDYHNLLNIINEVKEG